MDWESDPELKAMRDEFVVTFDERRRSVEVLLDLLEAGRKESRDELQFIAHKIAGVAESYGFPTLTRIGERIDELLDLPGGARIAGSRLRLFAELLIEAFKEAGNQTQGCQDPAYLMSDPRMCELTSDAESVRAESTRESS